MNDKDRELIQQILQAGGAAAQKGFEELVHWCFMDALANTLCYAAVAGIVTFAFVRLLKWKIDTDGDSEAPNIVRGIGLVACFIVLTITTGTWLPGNLREIFAPTGEAVAYVLSHH